MASVTPVPVPVPVVGGLAVGVLAVEPVPVPVVGVVVPMLEVIGTHTPFSPDLHVFTQ